MKLMPNSLASKRWRSFSPVWARVLRGTVVASALLAILVFPLPARAGYVLSIQNTSVAAGGSGVFDVFITATNSPTPLGGFTFETNVGTTSGITFTAVNFPASASNYVFGATGYVPATTSSFNIANGIPLLSLPLTASDANGQDSYINFGQAATLPNNIPLELGEVSYTASSSLGGGTVIPVTFGAGTSLSDANSVELLFTKVTGTITIQGTSATPEPSSLALAAMGGLTLAASWYRRIRKQWIKH